MRNKMTYRYPVYLTFLLACLLDLLADLGVKNGEWRRFFIEIHAKHAGPTRG